jgi:transposase-like protein
MLDRIPSDAKMRAVLFRATFGIRPHCPRCGSGKVKRSEARYRCAKCRKPFSLTSVSWLRGTKLGYRDVFVLLTLWQKRVAFRTAVGISGLSHVTVRRWFRKFRTHLVYESPVLSGSVEIDESWLGKKRHGNQTIAIGAIERSSGKAVIRGKGTKVFSDAWLGYRGIDRFFGYRHSAHIHDRGDFGPTNHIENLWSRLKSFITRTWHHCWREHLPDLLREFEARINAPSLFDSPLGYLENCLFAVPSR